MIKRLLTVFALIVIAAVAAAAWQLQNPDSVLRDRLAELTNNLPNVNLPTGISLPSLPALQQPVTEITTPGPLRSTNKTPAQTLTASGVLSETNQRRAEASVPALAANAKLTAAAQAKVSDMFAKQYFDHVGPDGNGPAHWVEGAGYAYIAIGENLALGNFAGDTALVDAWMASPGHRANILHKNFAEIGIAVGQGIFEGETTWLAVQEFGTPASACPTPQASLQTQFNQKKTLTAQLEKELEATKNTLDQLVAKHDQLLAAGNAKIEEGNRAAKRGDQEEAEKLWAEGEALQNQARELEPQVKEQQEAYNNLVSQLNTLNNELIDLARQLNAQIDQYNLCVAKFGS